MLFGACSSVPPAALPTPARPILPLPAPVQLQDVKPTLEDRNGDVAVVYPQGEHQKLTDNLGELYRWIAEAMTQLEFYRREED